MKIHFEKTRKRGVALVIVLAMLVLATGLVIAFFSTVTNDAGSSVAYSNDVQVKQLADSTVNLVIGQIVEGTKGFEQDATSGAADYTKPLAWASQPGAIRTFKENGTADRVFKLYSSRRLVATATEMRNDLDAASTSPDVPADWASRTALYTDINAPVQDEAGNAVYPIVDPRAKGVVEGFDIVNAPLGTSASGTNAAPMPAQWLYLLKSGTITSPTIAASTGGTAGWGSGSNPFVPTAANPIVARIAFWTDDETSKININTAAEGTFWDVPRADTNEERNLAKFQPAQKEFQRYPGHPAMTSLSVVFPNLTKEEVYALVPRVVGGGSRGGSVVPSGKLSADRDRLYASLDELLFPTTTRTTGAVAKADLERKRFFLTAASRAPEINLYNKPRVAIWPIDSGTAGRTAYDRLIAHSATVKNTAFYFQRQNPKSATVDVTTGNNTNVYSYLQNLTAKPVPGFGGSLLSKYPTDRDQILTQIFDYIRSTNLDDSGLAEAARFASRAKDSASAGFQAGFGQVTPLRIAATSGTTQGFGRFPCISEVGIHFICTAKADDPATAGTDESLGSNVVGNKTLGNVLLTGSQRRIEALLFFETFIPGQGWPPVWPAYTMRVRGAEDFQINGVSLGFPADEYDLSNTNGGSIYHGRNWGGVVSHRTQLAYAKLPDRGPMPADGSANEYQKYRYVSVPITIDAGLGTMSFSGGTLTVDLFAERNANPISPVQTYTLAFPSGTFPLPELVATPTPAIGGAPATLREHWWTFSKDGCGLAPNGRVHTIDREPIISGLSAGSPFRSEDVVRTLVPSQAWADLRLIAATINVPSAAFTKHPLYDNQSRRIAHTLTEGGGTAYFDGFVSDPTNLVSGISWNTTRTPDVAIANPASNTNGDWDNGVSITTDGAFINKPDEGNTKNIATNIPYFEASHEYTAAGDTFFSPNRQMPSAGMFGSLPTGVKSGSPFRTLLFRPQPAHPGAVNPPDHLFMDLFWMPVVEPYAISEPFSTAGKINMNTAIVPFSYIKRQTSLHALLKAEQVMAIPNANGGNYKSDGGTLDLRKPINITETLRQFDDKFAATSDPGVFLSPTQISELHLVPEGQTVGNMTTFWSSHKLTGDNSRERPYTNLLGRLTTKSNTYTVHFRVQALKKVPGTPVNQWIDGRDQVLSEYRGSTTIERYIDPNDDRLPDFATETDQARANMDAYYRFRTVSTKRFAP